MTEFTKGQRVTIEGREGVDAITTVEKIGSLKMTLANGEQWKAGGRRRWGTGYSYWSPTVRPHQEGDEEKLWRRTNLSVVDRFTYWSRLTDEQLSTVAGIIRKLPEKVSV